MMIMKYKEFEQKMNPFSNGDSLYEDKDLKKLLKGNPNVDKDEKIIFDLDQPARKFSIGSEKSG